MIDFVFRFLGVLCPRRGISFGADLGLVLGLVGCITAWFCLIEFSAPAVGIVLLIAGAGFLAFRLGLSLKKFWPELRRASRLCGCNCAIERWLAPVLLVGLIVGALYLHLLTGYPLANYDVLSYHLPILESVAKQATAHQMFWDPVTFYERLPFGGQLLQWMFVGNFGAISPAMVQQQWLNAGVLCASAICAARIVARLGGSAVARVLAAFLVLTNPMSAAATAAGLTDPFVGLFALAALEFLLRPRTAWNVGAAGLLMGSAATVKLGAAGVVIVPLVVVGGVLWSRPIWRAKGWCKALVLARFAVSLGVGLGLALGPWMIRGWVLSGSPLHPFGGFSAAWTAEQAAFVVGVHEPLAPLSGAWFANGLRRSGIFGLGLPTALPGLLLVVGFVAACAIRRRFWGIGAAVVLGYAAFVGVRGNPERFALPTVLFFLTGLAAVFGGSRGGAACTVSVGEGEKRLRGVLSGTPKLVFLVVALLAGQEFFPRFWAERNAEHFRGAEERGAALDLFLGGGFMEPVREASAAHREERSGNLMLMYEARPSVFGIPRGRILPRSYTVWDNPAGELFPGTLTAPEEILALLKAQGVTGVFVNEFEFARLLSFYAKDRLPRGGAGLMSSLSLSEAVSEDDRMSWLKAYPPARFAGLKDAEALAWVRFLARLRMTSAAPGPGPRVWYSKI